MPKPVLGSTKSPVRLVPGFTFRGKKRLGLDTDHSSSTWAEFKNEWRCTSTPHICLLGVGKDKIIFFCLCVYESLDIFSGFATKDLYAFPMSSIGATRYAFLITHNFIVLITFSEEYIL